MKLVRRMADGLEHEDGLVFFPEECETLAANYVAVPAGGHTHEEVHPDEEEIYVILTGTGEAVLNGAAHPVAAGDAVYIPRNVYHYVRGGEAGLTYLCVANWPDKKAGSSEEEPAR